MLLENKTAVVYEREAGTSAGRLWAADATSVGCDSPFKAQREPTTMLGQGRTGWPMPSRFPSLSRNHAARSPEAPDDG
jgi:hypothetical protein